MRKDEKITVQIRSMNSNGEGIASVDGCVVFVENALPGEEVLATVTEVSRNYARATTLKINHASPNRTTPPCPVFGQCGGCQLQHLSYPAQLSTKRQRVIDALERIGKLHSIEVNPCIPSPQQFGYRNKVQLPQSGNTLGLYARDSHTVVPINHCLIHNSIGEEVLHHIKKLPLPPLRHVLIKSSEKRREALVVFVTRTPLPTSLATQLIHTCPLIKGVVENVNQRDDNVILSNQFKTLAGQPFIEEELCGKLFRISPHSFFQVNTPQAEQIFSTVATLLGNGNTLVDAFCGVGTLALIAAHQFKKVVGIECVPLAIQDAQTNATRNNIHNCTFIVGQAEKKITPSDALFLNPPRKGCEQTLLNTLCRTLPKRIVYMSCHPETLARDLAILQNHYTIQQVTPFDMFPQTTHVETVVQLNAKPNTRSN